MFSKLRTVITFFFATILLTTCLATVFLWAKSWAGDFLKTQGVTCNDFNGITWCTLPQGDSSVDLLNLVDEPMKCMRTMLVAPKTMTYGINCSNETVVPATCAIYLREAENHYCAFAIHLPRDWIPSKATVIIWIMAFNISIIAVIYIFRRFRKHQDKGTVARIPQHQHIASTSSSRAAVGKLSMKRSYPNPSIWTKLWAWKSGYKVDGLGGHY